MKLLRILRNLLSVQKGLSKPKKKAAKSTVNVDVIFVKLQDTFRERVRMYNDGELTKEKPKRTKAASFLPRNKQNRNNTLARRKAHIATRL